VSWEHTQLNAQISKSGIVIGKREYVEDEGLVIRIPSQATPEIDDPDHDQDAGNNCQNVSHVCQRKSRNT